MLRQARFLAFAPFAIALACSPKPPPPPPAAAVEVLSDAMASRSTMEALAKNAQTYGQTLQKHARIFDADRVYERVPERFDAAALRAQLEAAAAKARVKLVKLEVSEPPPPARALPEAWSGDAKFPLEPDDVIFDVTATADLSPSDPDRARLLRDELRGSGALWRFEGVTLAGRTMRVEAKVAFFRDTRMPRYVLPGADLDRDLAAAGAPRLSELAAGPNRALAAELEQEYVRRAAARAQAEPGLANLARVHLLDARYAQFKRIAGELESFTGLLK